MFDTTHARPAVYDSDKDETQEWIEAYTQVLEQQGVVRAQYLLNHLKHLLHLRCHQDPIPSLFRVGSPNRFVTSEVPDSLYDPERIRYRLAIRWNAVAMVLRAMRHAPELGGHLASGLSIADLYDVAFEYFLHGRSEGHLGDCVYFQGHSSPMIYARSFLEGHMTSEQLDRFRQEVGGGGLSSYPHPYRMPDYWQFPTVSMGLGLLQAIHQARIMKYLDQRGILALGRRRVWAFVGDGEMREPESVGALNLAAVDQLAHLTVVVNINLQGLDGLCFGSGSILSEYAAVFEGAGWRVIRLVWNQAWLDLFASEPSGIFESWMSAWVDGDHQNLYCRGVEYLVERVRAEQPQLLPWLETQRTLLEKLKPAGHDLALIYQAYREAVSYTAGPSVVLVQTIKGQGLPVASQNSAHQHKKLTDDELRAWAHYCRVPLSPEDQGAAIYYRNPLWAGCFLASSAPIPKRYTACSALEMPGEDVWSAVASVQGSCSTTTSFVRVLGALLRSPSVRQYVVPIVADEARTFGMEGLFKHIGVYAPKAPVYEPHDAKHLLGHREGPQGQLIQEGVNEAGAMASWIACATAYSAHALPLIPFYIFYSMFGFQRVMDLIWAASDSCARGFLLGATSGKTTLAGEGLQHADGHSLLLASVVPQLVCYDPAWHQEVVWILRAGMKRMLVDQENVIVYMTLVNESVPQVSLPPEAEAGALQGMYLFEAHEGTSGPAVPIILLGSGALFHEAYRVFACLRDWDWSVAIYSVTSYPLLRQEAREAEKAGSLPYVSRCFPDKEAYVFSVSDYVSLLGEMLRPWAPPSYHVLGTDGFGLSDTRAALRSYFSVDAQAIMAAVLSEVERQGTLDADRLEHYRRMWEHDDAGTN